MRPPARVRPCTEPHPPRGAGRGGNVISWKTPTKYVKRSYCGFCTFLTRDRIRPGGPHDQTHRPVRAGRSSPGLEHCPDRRPGAGGRKRNGLLHHQHPAQPGHDRHRGQANSVRRPDHLRRRGRQVLRARGRDRHQRPHVLVRGLRLRDGAGTGQFRLHARRFGGHQPIGGSYRGYDFIPGNDLAGDNPIHAYAFVDSNNNNKDDDESPRDNTSETIKLLRETRFDNSLNASPEPVRRGKPIKVTADLSTADWDDGVWAGVDAQVKVQFRADGEKSYRTVKTVTATGGHLDTKVTATRSGSWRASYAGSDTTASSTSNADFVKVNRGR